MPPEGGMYHHNPTMLFIEKSVALPEIMTLSSVHSQYRIPVRSDAWKAVMFVLLSRFHQYGAIIQCVEPAQDPRSYRTLEQILVKRSHILYLWR